MKNNITPEQAYEEFMQEEQMLITVSADIDIIRASLDALLQQLTDDVSVNRIKNAKEALKRLGKHIDEMENAMMAMSDSLGE